MSSPNFPFCRCLLAFYKEIWCQHHELYLSFGSTACLISSPPSTHDARCYSSQCVCGLHICHKCSLCNSNSQPGSLALSCLPCVSQLWLYRIRQFFVFYNSHGPLLMKNAWIPNNTRLWSLPASRSIWWCLFRNKKCKKKKRFSYYHHRCKTECCVSASIPLSPSI